MNLTKFTYHFWLLNPNSHILNAFYNNWILYDLSGKRTMLILILKEFTLEKYRQPRVF